MNYVVDSALSRTFKSAVSFDFWCIWFEWFELVRIILCCVVLYYITLHCIALHCVTLHYITSHHITLHYITLHYITLYNYPWLHFLRTCNNWHPVLTTDNMATTIETLHWRHNDHDSVSNHQPHSCLLSRLFRRSSKKTSKLRVTGLCVENSPGPVISPHKGPVSRKMFPFDDVIMINAFYQQEVMGYSSAE